MIRSLNTAEQAMKMEQVRIDALANNLANVNTTGFKQILTRVSEGDGPAPADGSGRGPEIAQTTGLAGRSNWAINNRMNMYHAMDNRRGPVEATGRDTDVAIMGDGFFKLQTPDGTRYTRNGSFVLDSERQLTAMDGSPLLGDGGPIRLEGREFEIGADGQVVVDGKQVGRLQLVTFADPTRLEHLGNGLLTNPDDMEATPVPQEEVIVAQGHIEGSNVNPIDTLVAMIAAQRAFEVQTKVTTTEDEMLSKSVNTLPRAGS